MFFLKASKHCNYALNNHVYVTAMLGSQQFETSSQKRTQCESTDVCHFMSTCNVYSKDHLLTSSCHLGQEERGWAQSLSFYHPSDCQSRWKPGVKWAEAHQMLQSVIKMLLCLWPTSTITHSESCVHISITARICFLLLHRKESFVKVFSKMYWHLKVWSLLLVLPGAEVVVQVLCTRVEHQNPPEKQEWVTAHN